MMFRKPPFSRLMTRAVFFGTATQSVDEAAIVCGGGWDVGLGLFQDLGYSRVQGTFRAIRGVEIYCVAIRQLDPMSSSGQSWDPELAGG